jgi:glycosyltransferase involved in cell wall biosynthesis
MRACLEFWADVVHLNQSGCYRVLLPAATLLNLPIVGHVRIFEDAAYLARQRPDPRRLRGLIAISSAIQNEIRSFLELDAIETHQIYDAYAPSAPSTVTEKRIRNRMACVGRVVPVKGQEILAQAIQLLRKDDLECHIVGGGDADFIRKIKEIEASGTAPSSLQWTGFIRDVMPLLRTCSAVVCPSHREPLGRVLFEAWDAGAVPIVFAGSGGAAEIVTASQGGITYDKQEPESLARALQAALEMEDEQKLRLVSNGRLWMEKNCSPSSYGRAVVAILSNACNPPHRPQ